MVIFFAARNENMVTAMFIHVKKIKADCLLAIVWILNRPKIRRISTVELNKRKNENNILDANEVNDVNMKVPRTIRPKTA
jgi:hypothetical protein